MGHVNEAEPGVSTGLTESIFTKGSNAQSFDKALLSVVTAVFWDGALRHDINDRSKTKNKKLYN